MGALAVTILPPLIFTTDQEADDLEESLVLLDEAPGLCAFNGVSFDVPFICAPCHWHTAPQRTLFSSNLCAPLMHLPA